MIRRISTSTWTRSSRRSGSATIRRCGAGRSPSAGVRRSAVSSPPPVTKRAFGVYSAMPMSGPCFARRWSSSGRTCAKAASTRCSIFRDHAAGQPLSLDEAYLDVTRTRGARPATSVLGGSRAHSRRHRATASAGVARQVPGQDRLRLEETGRPDRDQPRPRQPFWQLPVDALWGVGPVWGKLRARIDARGRARRICNCPRYRGASPTLRQLAGVDDRLVTPNRGPSRGVGGTYPED